MGSFATTAAQVVGVVAAPFTGGASLYLTMAATAAQAYGQQQEAGAQQVQLRLQQRQERMAASDREVQRQRRLNAILGSQAAAAAAQGVAMSGSIANLSMIDAKRAAEDSLVDRISTGQRITALRTESKNIGRVANIRTAGTLLSAGQKIASRGSTAPAGTK